jgi:effector-binding domain-containing protein
MTPPSISAVRATKAALRPFAAVRARLPVADVPRRFGVLLDQVYALGREGGVKLDGQNIFLYHPTESADIVDVHFGVGVTEPFVPSGNVVASEIPATSVATATLIGDYSGISGAHHAVVDWCKANGRHRTGTRWEIYGHWTSDPAQLRTDVFHELTG